MTEWRAVAGTDGRYSVSDEGQVIGPRGHIIKLFAGTHDYLIVRVGPKGQRKTRSLHRVVAEAFHGPCPPDMEARHLDGNRFNNRANNLAWSTHRVNILDKARHGTMRAPLCRRGLHPRGDDDRCRPCFLAYQRAYRARKRALAKGVIR